MLSSALITLAFAQSQTITSDPSGISGAVTYKYNTVGNRPQKVASLPGYPGGLSNYNANDQLTTDTYDANGNTTTSNALGYAYDFENHLIQQGGISIVYDGNMGTDGTFSMFLFMILLICRR